MKRKKLPLPYMKIFVAVLICLFLLGYLFIRVNTHFWNGNDKIAKVVEKNNGDTEVVLIDPKFGEIIIFTIPGDTEVSVAKNYGVMRLKNVWQLGVNEGLGGSLVSQTVSQNFLFPLVLWENVERKTNIPLGDRLFLRFFELKTKNLEKTEIDLAKSQFLRKGKLSDGEMGFKLNGKISERLTAYFNDPEFQNKKIYIKDATGKFGITENMGRILEVFGGKIVAIEKLPQEKLRCEVWGKNKKMVFKVAMLFSCKSQGEESNFDLEIRVGSEFL